MPITTTGTLPAPVQQWFNHTLLSVATPEYIHRYGAMTNTIPRKSGNTIRYRRYNPLPSALVPLGNGGIDPPSTALNAIDIDARISWYGQWVELNEQVVLENQDPVLNEAAERLAQSMRQTSDELIRNMLEASAAQVNAIAGVNGDNPTELAVQDIGDVVSALLSADAKRMLDVIQGEDRFATAPVANSYLAMCHTDLSQDLRNVAGFIHVAQYPAQGKVLRSEWGNVENVRFFISSIGSKLINASGLGNDLYNVFITGMEAYACVDLDGANAQYIYHSPELSGPLNQNSTVGWKFAEVPRLLNDTWLIALRCTRA